MEILIKRLKEEVKLPAYAHATDPGISLYAGESVTIEPGQRVAVGLGVAMAIPVGYVGVVWHQEGLQEADTLHPTAMIIDSGCREEVRIELTNTGAEAKTVSAGGRIAQLLIQKIEQPRLIEAEDLSEAADENVG